MKRYFNNISILVFLFGAILISQSCVKELDTDFDEFESKLVLNAMVSTELPWFLELSKSGNILSATDNIEHVNDATVVVNDITNNNMIKLESVGNGRYQHEFIKPIAGHSYEVKVHHPAFKSIKAFTAVPGVVDIVKTDSNSVLIDGIETWNIDFEILNEQRTQQYYICELFKVEKIIKDNEEETSFVSATSDYQFFQLNTTSAAHDRELNNGVRYFVQDENNGGVTSLTVVQNSDENGEGEGEEGNSKVSYYYELKIKSVSESFFDYLKALEEYNSNKENNSSQTHPSSFYSNIEGGFGILGASNSQVFEF